jgi:phosphatidylinositol-4,5-bisphosphate 3-kinase
MITKLHLTLTVRAANVSLYCRRAEMHQSTIRLRFALVLEAYCRGCGAFIKCLHRQVDALDKLTKLSNLLKAEREV